LNFFKIIVELFKIIGYNPVSDTSKNKREENPYKYKEFFSFQLKKMLYGKPQDKKLNFRTTKTAIKC
jgi:hypothetical protein